MGCSSSRTNGAAAVKKGPSRLHSDGSGQYPHCSASEVVALRMSCELSDADPTPLEQRGSNSRRGGASDLYPGVTRKNLSDIKRLRTTDKIKTWQHSEQNVRRSVSQQPSPPTNTTPRQGVAANGGGVGAGAATSPRKTHRPADIPIVTIDGPPTPASSNSPDSSSNRVDEGMAATIGPGDAPAEADDVDEVSDGAWKKRISILAARCLVSGGVFHDVNAATSTSCGQDGHEMGATATSPRAITTTMTPAATNAIASNAAAPSGLANGNAVGEQTKFVVVAKVNNPFTGVNLVYRKSEHVIGVGSSATVYLGSVTTTAPMPTTAASSSASTGGSQPPTSTSTATAANNISGGGGGGAPSSATRKFLTAIKEILVSPAAVLFESPSGEQVATRRRQEAIDAVKHIQDVHQLLRQEFRFLKSLDGCAQVVRVLHVAVTAGGDGGTAASPLVAQGSISPGGGGVAGEQLSDEALGCLPLHMRPQRARIFMEYVKFGTLLAESRRLYQLYQHPNEDVGVTPSTPESRVLAATRRTKCGPGAFRMHELTARAYMKDVLLGLCYLHEHKCLHRDVKPQNILVHALVEDMYETAFPVCLEDSITMYTAPPLSDDDEDADGGNNNGKQTPQGKGGGSPKKAKKPNSTLLPRGTAGAVAQPKKGTASVGGGGGGKANTKLRMHARVASANVPPEDAPLIADLDVDAFENRSRQRQGNRSCTMLDADGIGADGRLTPSLSQQRFGSPLPPAVSVTALDDLSPLQQPPPPAPFNRTTATRSPRLSATASSSSSRVDGMSVVEVQDNVLRTTTVPFLRGNHHANHRDKLKTLIKLTDFGSARWTIPTGVGQGEGGTIGFLRETAGVGCPTTMNVVGTAPYMSPESIRGKFSAASDMWSFAITFLEMVLPSDCSVWSNLNAKDPFQLILRLGTVEPPEHMPDIPAHLSPECRDMLARCLAYAPAHRPTALELLQDVYFGTTGWIGPRLKSGALESPWCKKDAGPS